MDEKILAYRSELGFTQIGTAATRLLELPVSVSLLSISLSSSQTEYCVSR